MLAFQDVAFSPFKSHVQAHYETGYQPSGQLRSQYATKAVCVNSLLGDFLQQCQTECWPSHSFARLALQD